MKKRILLTLFLVTILSFKSAFGSVVVLDSNIVDSGTCGDNVTWTLESNGTLTIAGSGEMEIYYNEAPWYSYRDRIRSVVIQNGVTSIGEFAFHACVNATSITIPDSVTRIDRCAFWGCMSLTSITIPDGVTSIGYKAFMVCQSLTSISIPNSMTKIDDSLFLSCSSLSSVDIPIGITKIGADAFSGCENLISVVLPVSVTEVDSSAFYKCNALESIVISNTNCKIYDSKNTIYGLSATIKGHHNSTAQSYADKYGHVFSPLSVCSHAYTVDITKSATCGSDGVKTYTCSRCGITKTETIPATGNHTYKQTSITKATTSKNGTIYKKCSVCGKTATESIARPKTVTISSASYTYSGKIKNPTVTVKNSKGNKISSSSYTVSNLTGHKNVGSYKVTVKFKGTKYSGSLSTSFQINPKASALKSVTASSKGFTAKWNKVTTQTTGYLLQYSTNSKFTGAKTVTIANNKTTSKKVTKLTAKKKYYVRIRTYKTVGGKKYYSAWSSAKAVTTKK